MVRQYKEEGKLALMGDLPEILEAIRRLAIVKGEQVGFEHIGKKYSNTKVVIDVADKNKL